MEEIVVSDNEEKAIQQPEELEKVFCCFGERLPEFPDGTAELLNFVYFNLQFPPNLCCMQGTVFIGFTVKKDGTLSDFEVKRGLHPDLDAEAIRVLKLMLNWTWTSSKQSDIPEKILFTMPVKFKLTE